MSCYKILTFISWASPFCKTTSTLSRGRYSKLWIVEASWRVCSNNSFPILPAMRRGSLKPVERVGVKLAEGEIDEGVSCGIVMGCSGFLPWLVGVVLGTLLGGVEPLPSPGFLFWARVVLNCLNISESAKEWTQDLLVKIGAICR